MWVLVYIQLLFPNDISAIMLGKYDTLSECFDNREQFILEQTGEYDGYPKVGTQLVCIRTK